MRTKLSTGQILVICLFAIAMGLSCKSGIGTNEVKLIPVRTGEEFQYVDREGKIMINPQFKNASIFREGLALVQSSGNEAKWGYINEEGKYQILASYNQATVFSEGMAWVVTDNSAPMAINTKGEIKITLQDAEYVHIFTEGLAAFCINDSSGNKWGFVDKTGVIKISPQFYACGYFSEGKCPVKNKEGNWGYIDFSGKITINNQFDGASEYHNNRAIVSSDSKTGVIDESGKFVINPQFSNIIHDNDLFLVEQDGKWGWCDEDGTITINPQFSDAFPFFNEDLAPVKSGDSYGYIDKSGKLVINPQFDNAFPFNGEMAMVTSGDKIGFIDSKGVYTINPQFDKTSKDLLIYMLTGKTEFSDVETRFFNVAAISGRLKKDISENTIAGLGWNSNMGEILKKFAKTSADFSRYNKEHILISEENIAKDITMEFYMFGSPWNAYSNGWYNYQYSFNEEYSPTGFAYLFKVTGNGKAKEDEIIKSIQNALPAFVKDAEKSTESTLVLRGKKTDMTIFKKNGIVVLLTPASNSESY